ncbi:MAG: hypothetical protein ACREN8_04755 [Candidatus Dormibacteraceae bacterium]
MNAVTFPSTSYLPSAAPFSENHRRFLLAASDRLLSEVEELRLADQAEAPLPLRHAILQLYKRLGLARRRRPTLNLSAVHNLVFSVQERLLALNLERPLPLRHPGRAAGCPALLQINQSQRWKLLVLPARPDDDLQPEEWRELARQTVSRAFDRWDYAHHHALQAGRTRLNQTAAWQLERAAWKNYCALLEETTRLGATAD